MKKYITPLIVLTAVVYSFFYGPQWFFDGFSWVYNMAASIYHEVSNAFDYFFDHWLHQHPTISKILGFFMLFLLLKIIGGMADAHG